MRAIGEGYIVGTVLSRPIEIDRRAFVASSLAAARLLAVGGSSLPLFAQQAQPTGGMSKPSLTATFSPLQPDLLTREEWNFYPTLARRDFWSALPQDIRENLSARAETANTGDWPQLLATLELEFKRNGNRSRFEALHFERRSRLIDLVFGECVAANGKYLDQIANGIWLICEESFWGVQAHLGAQKAGVGLADTAEPIIDLFAAETSATLALVVHLLAERLNTVSPLLIPRIMREAQRRILSPYLDRNDFSWMGLSGRPHHLNNWNPWINSNVLTTTLLLDSDSARRKATVLKVCRSVDEYLFDYSADGGCEEGPAYWTRSAGSFFDLSQMLASVHGGKGAEMLQDPFTRAMGNFIANTHIAGDIYCNYGDAHLQAAPPPELVYRFGHDCGDSALTAFGAFLSAERGLGASGEALKQAMAGNVGGVASLTSVLNGLLVAKEIRTAPRRDALVRANWYPALALMTARAKEGSTAGFFLAMQAASNARSHGHNDSGSFIVFQNGEPLFIDIGVGTYEAKTFSKERYTIFSMQSLFHNLPIIDGIGEHEGRHNGSEYRASEARYSDAGDSTSMSADLATAYPVEAGVLRWLRTAALQRTDGTVQLAEAFELKEQKPVALVFMTQKPPTIENGNVRVGEAALHYDASQLTATSERIALTDQTLRHTWGEAIYRVLLTSRGPVSKGSWRIGIGAV